MRRYPCSAGAKQRGARYRHPPDSRHRTVPAGQRRRHYSARDRARRLLGVKQNMITDNRPGAAGSIAAELVARATPHGDTLLFGTTGVLAINPYLYSKLAYDPVKDFAPIGRTATSQYAIVVSPSLPVKTLKDYIACARARPGELNVGTSGTGTAVHLSGELFHSMTGIKTVHVCDKGATEALTDLMSGRVQAMFASLSSAISCVDT